MDPIFWLALVLSTAVDLGAIVVVLAWKRGSTIGFARVCAAAIASAALFAAKLPLLVAVASSFFFGIHLAYVDLFVAVPLAGAWLVLASRRRAVTRPARAVAVVALTVLPPIAIYATWIEPNRLVEERVATTVSFEHTPRAPLRIAVLADLQSREVDEHLHRAVRSAMAFEPHLVVLPGDLIQVSSPKEFRDAAPEFQALLGELSAPLGVYFTLGNTDEAALVRPLIAGTGVKLLENATVELEFGGRTIRLGGAGAFPTDPRTREFVRAFESRPGDDLRLLVSHYPDVLLDLEGPARIDLTISGHTHGGQVQIPGFGPPITLSRVSRCVAAGGFHDVNGRQLYISRGVGAERCFAPRVRFLAPPEVTLLTIDPFPAE